MNNIDYLSLAYAHSHPEWSYTNYIAVIRACRCQHKKILRKKLKEKEMEINFCLINKISKALSYEQNYKF
jgi:hypothetical protein